jgi:hypothetical protein
MIFAICGVMVIYAASTADPTHVADVGDTLDAIRTGRFGPWLLAFAGAGFVAYGVYQLAKARYRRLEMS